MYLRDRLLLSQTELPGRDLPALSTASDVVDQAAWRGVAPAVV